MLFCWLQSHFGVKTITLPLATPMSVSACSRLAQQAFILCAESDGCRSTASEGREMSGPVTPVCKVCVSFVHSIVI